MVKQHWIVKVEEAQQTTPEGQPLSRTMQLVMERAGVTQSPQQTLGPKLRTWLKPENCGRIIAAAQYAARVAVNGGELEPPALFPLMDRRPPSTSCARTRMPAGPWSPACGSHMTARILFIKL